jgi:hypothetical protein
MANEIIMKNKKGGMALRDIMFSIIIFAAIMALISIFVLDISAEYDNTNMSSEYTADDSIGSLGDTVFTDVNSSLSSMRENIDEGAGSFGLLTGVIGGVGTILKTVILSPVYIGNAIESMMLALRLPNPLPTIVGNTAIFLIYVIIIFVIISALSRGGTKL